MLAARAALIGGESIPAPVLGMEKDKEGEQSPGHTACQRALDKTTLVLSPVLGNASVVALATAIPIPVAPCTRGWASPSACLPGSPVEATIVLGDVTCWFVFCCCCCFLFGRKKYIYNKYINLYHYRIMH